MAENTTKQSDDTSDPQTDDTTSRCAETRKAIDKFLEDCEQIDLPIASNVAEVAKTSMDSYIQTICDNRRAWRKGEETREFYGQLYYNLAFGLSSDMTVMDKCVDDQITASDDIVAAYDEAIAKVKEACTKLTEVCRAAKDWSMDVTKTCNSKNKEELNKILKAKGLSEKELKQTAKKFEETARVAQDGGDQVIETATHVTSIYSFVNANSLKACVEDLKSMADEFAADTEANLKASEEKIKNALKTITDNTPPLSKGYFDEGKANAVKESIEMTANILKKDPLEKPTKTLVKIICDQVPIDDLCKGSSDSSASKES